MEEGYWDEEDHWVDERDPNIITVTYGCSYGHEWERKYNCDGEPYQRPLPP